MKLSGCTTREGRGIRRKM